MAELMENVAGNLQQRIGQLVSQYETDMAILRANASKQLGDKEAEINALREQLEISQRDLEETRVALREATIRLEGNNVPANEEAVERDGDTDS